MNKNIPVVIEGMLTVKEGKYNFRGLFEFLFIPIMSNWWSEFPQRSWPASCRAEKTSAWCSIRDYSAGLNVTPWPISCFSRSKLRLPPLLHQVCLKEKQKTPTSRHHCLFFFLSPPVLTIGSSIPPTLTLSSIWSISRGVRQQRANSEYRGQCSMINGFADQGWIIADSVAYDSCFSSGC